MNRLRKTLIGSYAGLCACLMVTSVSAQTIHIEDTFTRSDGADLGATEVGSYSYFTSGVANETNPEVAELFNGELLVYGHQGFFGGGVGMVLVDADLADVTMSADMRFEGLFNPSNSSTYNFGGFLLRRNDMSQGHGANNEGQIEVMMFPGGGIFIREVRNGLLNTLYGPADSNPFGLGGSNNNVYSLPGQLPVSVNGLSFDANGSGVLEDGESFRFGVSLVGNALDVLVNDLSILSLQVTHDKPMKPRSVSGFYKNRYTSSGTRDTFNIGLDNLAISGTAHALPGDFNNDNIVDGNDFLVWQRGGSPDPLSATDLTEWKANFGMVASVPATTANVGAVPEPASICLAAMGALAMLGCRRGRKR